MKPLLCPQCHGRLRTSQKAKKRFNGVKYKTFFYCGMCQQFILKGLAIKGVL